MIDTLDSVKAALKISGTADDALLTQLLPAADSFVSTYCRQAFGGGTYTEAHPGGRGVLVLANYPVDSVSAVRVDPNRGFGAETVRPAAAYLLHPARGVVESLAGPFLPPRPGRGADDWPGAVQVTYSTPADEVPAAVKQAFAQLVGFWYRQAKTGADAAYRLLAEQEDGTGRKAWAWDLTKGLDLPPEVLTVLDPFRAPAL